MVTSKTACWDLPKPSGTSPTAMADVSAKHGIRRCLVPDLEQNQNHEHFIQKARKYAELTKLTPYAAHELIKAVYVGALDKSSGKRRQSIHICYDLLGFIPLSELMEQGKA